MKRKLYWMLYFVLASFLIGSDGMTTELNAYTIETFFSF